MNEIKLIALYYAICASYDQELSWHCQRYSPNSEQPRFSDQELLTVYLYAVMEEEKFKVKSIHTYATRYLLSWFPDLPSYQAFNRRLNRLSAVFPLLAQHWLEVVGQSQAHRIAWNESILDSLPIITCSGKRTGKVASPLTDKGHCATKRLYYYGVKLHSIAFRCEGGLPLPEYLLISPASWHDLTSLRPIVPQLEDRTLYGDKIYADQKLTTYLINQHHTYLMTPVKLIKGQSVEQRQFNRAADKWYSRAVSSVRQPIESLFNWLIEKTDIQRASKVRSANGLIVHIFGKIAAAFAALIF